MMRVWLISQFPVLARANAPFVINEHYVQKVEILKGPCSENLSDVHPLNHWGYESLGGAPWE